MEIGVFSISIMASGASASGSGDTAFSPIGASSPAPSAFFPALLPNLAAYKNDARRNVVRQMPTLYARPNECGRAFVRVIYGMGITVGGR